MGLSRELDEDSIKVEGTGSAIISDIFTELVPNREIFDEVYSESDDDVEEDPADESEESEPEDSEIETLKEEIERLCDDRRAAQEVVSSAEARQAMLSHHSNSIKLHDPNAIRENIAIYEEERKKTFQTTEEGKKQVQKIDLMLKKASQNLKRTEKRKDAEKRIARAEKRKAQRAEEKRKDIERQRKAEATHEKMRIRNELRAFWPSHYYAVRITLDATSFTPSTSRRSSIASATDLVELPSKTTAADGNDISTCDLTLTYVTSFASWSPSYDVQLSTTTDKATLCFDAKITNRTSETWTNSKITLSTSQTTYSGLDDKIPTLKPWVIKLQPKRGGSRSSVVSDDMLYSLEEQRQKGRSSVERKNPPRAPVPAPAMFNSRGTMSASMGSSRGQQRMQMRPAPQPQYQLLAAPLSHTEAISEEEPMAEAFGAAAAAAGCSRSPDSAADFDVDAATLRNQVPEMSFLESAMEETGLTTTYDLPSPKTLAPRPTAIKQRVARISLSNVHFSHTVVAKYKAVAHLQARVRNSSRITLLAGRAGLTLDGTFLGQTMVPRCSIGETFTLPLGVDPAVRVVYPKPEVRRSTAGVFTKEESSVFTRTVTVVNTRSAGGRPINVVVLDQVPVSEDERLRIDIWHPKGLADAEHGVSTGVGEKDGKADKDWGRATATLKKNGEVSWEATVNPGKSAKLALEYVVALPSGDQFVSSDAAA